MSTALQGKSYEISYKLDSKNAMLKIVSKLNEHISISVRWIRTLISSADI